MRTSGTHGRRRLLLPVLFIIFLLFFTGTPAMTQIYEPEGLNLPGAWNGWNNPPTNLAFASSTQVSGGRVAKINSGTPYWQTIFSAAASGGDVTGGTYQWLFTSGPTSNPWGNKWGNVTVSMNILQAYTCSGGAANNSITLVNGKWYTMNWKDSGYTNTQAIFMETSDEPVNLLSVSVPSGILQNQAASINLTTSANPAPEEKFYLRYTTDNWVTSAVVPFTMTGSGGVASVPGQGPGITVKYYAFSSTVSGISNNYELYSMKLNNNSGNYYSYTISGLSSEANILSFTLPEQTGPAVINATNATVNIEVAYGTSLSGLTPQIIISPGASINPLSGTTQNFSAPFTYTVTAENGVTTKPWTVTVSVASLTINWANLQWPASGAIEPGQQYNVYGQVWINGQTGGATAVPSLQAWVGYSNVNTDPSTWTNWIPASFNGPSGNNDEFVANLGSAFTENGTYYYSMRYTVNGLDYVYGGYASTGGGFWDGTTNVSGILTVGITIDCGAFNGAVYSDPVMPLDNDNVTVYFDATKGNAALLNFTGDVYAHTAVLTDLSSGPSDWRYVKSGWGINTPETKMVRLSQNLYSLTINTPRSYYNVPSGEMIRKMVFVFRSDVPQGTSYLEHRNSDGSDLQLDAYDNNLHVRFNNPAAKQTILDQNTTIPVCVSALGQNSLSLYINNTLLKQQSSSSLTYSLIMPQLQTGQNWLKTVAVNGLEQVRDSVEIYLRGPVQVAELPVGAYNGINYVNDSTVTLVLHDPTGFKQFVYTIGDFNDWEVSDQGYMKRTPDGKRYWLTLTGIQPGEEYAYQYYIDGTMKLADPYAEKVLDPWNDQWIPTSTYPDLKPYPGGPADGVVSVFQTARPAYDWQVESFTPPALNNTQSDLFIYELLIRDFSDARTYSAVIEKLDYLKELGINAIQLMPVAEFDGNDSWGYSTNFFFAADKYYGTREALKGLVDAAHQKGIAIILDIVVNHSFGLNPMVRMYWNSSANQPSEHNPWFNQQSTHPYSVGYDYNHESGHTRQFFKDVFRYWLTEYKVDGFRLDLSKGLTQNYSGSNLGAWNAYDQSRINILNDYKAHIKWVNPNAYIILEHFADNSEETVLANSGYLLWSGMHNNYKQVAMGWENNSNFSWAYHGNRGWSYPNLVDYMETHDEERMLYEALNNGNSTNPSYNIRNFDTGLHHQEQGIVLFMGVPGPKMLYEFQEMGYDYSKFYGGSNTASKPPRWDYLDVPGRERLNRVVSAMAELRKTDAFRYGSFSSDLGLAGKKIWINHSSMSVVISANMGVNGFVMSPGFPFAGTWYDYFSGEAITVTDPGGHFFFFNPGDYRVFTSQPMPKPFHELNITVLDAVNGNPVEGVTLSLANSGTRTTSASGQAGFLVNSGLSVISTEKFGWLSQSVDTLINANTALIIQLQPGWDPSHSWVNLEYPGTGSIQPGSNYEVYAQVWINGVTNQAQADTTIQAWIGYSTSNTHPSGWSDWVPASYHAAVGNNDEYKANIGVQLTDEGTYYYASRFRKGNGSYAYGGFAGGDGGFWNGSTNISGIVTVQNDPQPLLSWVNLQYPGTGTVAPSQPFMVYAQAWIENLTGQTLPAPGLEAWIGYSTENSDPATWTNWIPASYAGASGNNDEFVANLGTQISSPGTYYYASRFRYNSGAYVYGGYSLTGGGFWNGTSQVSGVLTVTTSPPTVINWANLQWPGSGTISAGSDFAVYGQVYIAGLTGQSAQAPGLEAWVGYSSADTDPSTWTSWYPAAFNLPVGNNDEFSFNLGTQIPGTGTYYYVFRYRLNNGPFYYGGYSSGGGGFWDGTQYTSGTLDITAAGKTLNLTLFLEGLYSGAGSMRKAQGDAGDQYPGTVADKITVELHDAASYSTVLYSFPDVDLNTNGSVSLSIPAGISGSCYIGIRHRNSVETASAQPVSFAGNSISYSFSADASQAFGDNLKAAPGAYLIFGGDVNQDNLLDSGDMIGIDNDASAFVTGYISNDVNGDGLIDSGDMIVVDNNVSAFVGAILP